MIFIETNTISSLFYKLKLLYMKNTNGNFNNRR